MSCSAAFFRLRRAFALAVQSLHSGVDAAELIQAEAARSAGRRRLLQGIGALSAAAVTPAWAVPRTDPAARVAVVGAGLAGLGCADELARHGVRATVFEASTRAGGRCYSLRNFFPGQVAELGGEFIDTPHKTMIAYAREFGLALEDVGKDPGEIFYDFDGQRYAESAVVDEFRALVPRMREDLRRIGAPTAASFTPDDQFFDYLNLREYLETRGAGALAFKAIEQAYIAEFGLEIEQQSCLSLLLFMHADRRSKFTPFGVFSDERYHLAGGNDLIAQGIAARLGTQIETGRTLRGLRRESGEYVLSFDGATHRCDFLVLAIPFSVLRQIELDASLGLPADKQYAIDNLRYGTNAKMMLGFDGRPWRDLGSNGTSYSNLPHHQTTWESNAVNATAQRGLITDYSGGLRGASLDPANVQGEAMAFLDDLDKVYPGAAAAASREAGGALRAYLQHWPSNPLTQGSYTANQPGYFTTIADNEATPVDRLYFAGEHTSSFYEWQGYMEGALLSGQRAAGEVLGAARLK